MSSSSPAVRALPLIIGAGLLGLGLGLALVQHLRAYGTPDDAVSRCLELAGGGDLNALVNEARCGFYGDRASQLAERHGRERFDRIVGIYLQAGRLASTEFNRVIRRIDELGRNRFHELPREQQRAIRERSTIEWVMTTGLAELSVEDRRGITNVVDELVDSAGRERTIRRLGESALDAGLRRQVHGRTDEQLRANPETSHLANVRYSAGRELTREVERRARREGRRAFRRLPYGERRRIENRSLNEWILERGFGALSQEDRHIAPSLEIARQENASQVQEHLVGLGRALLSAEERAVLPPSSLEEFRAQRDEFIAREGRRLAQADLQDLVRRSSRVLEVDLTAGRDSGENLFRYTESLCTVAWTGDRGQDGSRIFGSRVELYFDAPHWRITEM